MNTYRPPFESRDGMARAPFSTISKTSDPSPQSGSRVRTTGPTPMSQSAASGHDAAPYRSPAAALASTIAPLNRDNGESFLIDFQAVQARRGSLRRQSAADLEIATYPHPDCDIADQIPEGKHARGGSRQRSAQSATSRTEPMHPQHERLTPTGASAWSRLPFRHVSIDEYEAEESRCVIWNAPSGAHTTPPRQAAASNGAMPTMLAFAQLDDPAPSRRAPSRSGDADHASEHQSEQQSHAHALRNTCLKGWTCMSALFTAACAIEWGGNFLDEDRRIAPALTIVGAALTLAGATASFCAPRLASWVEQQRALQQSAIEDQGWIPHHRPAPYTGRWSPSD